MDLQTNKEKYNIEYCKEVLKEIFNMGICSTAKSLSVLADNKYEVKLSIPHLEILNLGQIIKKFESDDKYKTISCVSQKYSGSFQGIAYMFYSQDDSLKLVKLMLNSNLLPDQISELETDSLLEIGNLLLNACLSAMGNFLKEEIKTELPEIKIGTAADVFGKRNLETKIIFINSKFSLSEHDLNGHFSLFLESDRLDQLLKLVQSSGEKYFGVFE
ncbi:MAG: hypothetical protein HQK51_17875 [Oligoflexia bacterium]|nr:hypothetical protein [Oligoflexia bacterium]